MLVAPSADVFFWVVGEISRSCSLCRAVFRFLGDTDFNLTTRVAVRGEVGEETDPLIFTRSNDMCGLLFSQPFGSQDTAAFLSALLG